MKLIPPVMKMPELKWEVFLDLEGARTRNWELLCRGLVRRNYQQYGTFAGFAQQAGVEFHLCLKQECSLGKAGRWWGWQCKWYDLSQGRPIGTKRKETIEDALRKTVSHLPDLTDWVLWTRFKLTPADEKWIRGLDIPFELHLWSSDEVEEHLAGEASILRSVYFGDLVLTDQMLRSMHETCVAPIEKRWDPAVHTSTYVEREVNRTLMDADTWSNLNDLGSELENWVDELNLPCEKISDEEASKLNSVCDSFLKEIEHLKELHATISNGDFSACKLLASNGSFGNADGQTASQLLRRFRNLNVRQATILNQVCGLYREMLNLLPEINSHVDCRLLALVGDAGMGKTHLSAQLTAPNDDCAGGVLLLARPLAKSGTINDLVQRITGFAGTTFQELAEAVDAAGARAGRRIPIVIDGLNESESPSDWHDLLASANVALRRYENIVLIVTVRPSMADDALPESAAVYQTEGFDERNVWDAVRRFFEHYKINATDLKIPLRRFQHPLFLKIFCLATNPEREEFVGLDKIPRSLTAVFQKFLEGAISRVHQLIGLSKHDIERRLEDLALALWEKDARSLDIDEAREIAGDGREWNKSLARALEEEGVLDRDREPGFLDYQSSIQYDAFGGFLIADAIMNKLGRDGFRHWLSSDENLEKLNVNDRTAQPHPLGDDVFKAMVGLMPRRHHTQLWESVDGDLKVSAIHLCCELEAEYLDRETTDELKKLLTSTPRIFGQLMECRASEKHPLNVNFLTEAINPMNVANRDLLWSEWIRQNHVPLKKDVGRWISEWKNSFERDESDRLRAKWYNWLLTSSVRNLRDLSTKALYWFGIGDASSLFQISTGSLSINDSYVAERTFAASYGVCLANQFPSEEFQKSIAAFLAEIHSATCIENATCPTPHFATRDYIQHIVYFALRFCPDTIPKAMLNDDGKVNFEKYDFVENSEEWKNLPSVPESTLGDDFENYSIGRLFPDRRNYDFSHEEYSAARDWILKRAGQIGWRYDRFSEIDRKIRDQSYRRRDETTVERYGRKYALIALHDYVGKCQDESNLESAFRGDSKLPMTDIDPSFPETPPTLPMKLSNWIKTCPADHRKWLTAGNVNIPKNLLVRKTIGEERGPWILSRAWIDFKKEELGRTIWGTISAFLVSDEKFNQAKKVLASKNCFPNRTPDDAYTFAGEIPWSDEFGGELYKYDDSIYEIDLNDRYDDPFPVELICHQYGWESYHSAENISGGWHVPSSLISNHGNLRTLAGSLDQVDLNGKKASLTFTKPESADAGNLLFVRADIVNEYLTNKGLRLLWLAKGEKMVKRSPEHKFYDIYARDGHYWRQVFWLQDEKVHQYRPPRKDK